MFVYRLLMFQFTKIEKNAKYMRNKIFSVLKEKREKEAPSEQALNHGGPNAAHRPIKGPRLSRRKITSENILFPETQP